MFSYYLHVSVYTEALPIWKDIKVSSGTFCGNRCVDCMAHHVKHDTIVVERVVYQEACELCSLRIEMGSEDHIFFLLPL